MDRIAEARKQSRGKNNGNDDVQRGSVNWKPISYYGHDPVASVAVEPNRNSCGGAACTEESQNLVQRIGIDQLSREDRGHHTYGENQSKSIIVGEQRHYQSQINETKRPG